MKNKTILLISPESWGTSFVSKHHYANYLAKQNTVYFLNPVLNSVINPLGNVNAKVKEIKENLFEVNYQNLLPKLNRLPKFIQRYIYRKQAEQIHNFDIVWSFDPYRFWDLDFFKSKKKLYHAVDVHQAKYEIDICNSADAIIIISNYLKNRIISHKKVIQLNHGVRVSDKINKFMPPIKRDNRVKVGFMGNITSTNIDFDILLKIAKKIKPIADLIIVGPTKANNLGRNHSPEIDKKIKLLNECNNVNFYGEVKAENLNTVLSQFNIHLILYKNFERNIAPHKISNYFETGLVVLSSYIFDIDTYPKESIIALEKNKSIPNKLLKLIENLDYWNSVELQKIRKEYAITNSYDNKIEEINQLLYKN